jgi:hypothetical protein
MKNHAVLCALALTASLFAPHARADAAHEASAMALLDDSRVMAISILLDSHTLILSKDYEVPGLKCEILEGWFLAYILDGYLNSTRAGCFHLTDDGIKIKWQDGGATEIEMADVIVNRRRD